MERNVNSVKLGGQRDPSFILLRSCAPARGYSHEVAVQTTQGGVILCSRKINRETHPLEHRVKRSFALGASKPANPEADMSVTVAGSRGLQPPTLIKFGGRRTYLVLPALSRVYRGVEQ